ncbi:hypothetical protein KCG53_00815 [Neisseria subflava]|uniref:Uncharacterized protein n=1 Tax=Neisseria subflava TaxID=28449 RepID=A0A9X9N6Z3_NEISU|nr:hypothetical protein KCG53_00815 [Neisseria subflava]
MHFFGIVGIRMFIAAGCLAAGGQDVFLFEDALRDRAAPDADGTVASPWSLFCFRLRANS